MFEGAADMSVFSSALVDREISDIDKLLSENIVIENLMFILDIKISQ